MHHSKKPMIIILAAALLIAAAPMAAQIAGNWEGTGTGSCYPANGIIIYPWQTWQGEIPNAQNVFKGEWQGSDGNHGIFKSKILWISVTTAIATGSWYWYDPTGAAEPVYGGDFKMKFEYASDACTGTWTTIWPSSSNVGTMTAWKVN